MPARFLRRRAQGARSSCELLSSARFRPPARRPGLHRCRTRRFRTFHDSAILTASPGVFWYGWLFNYSGALKFHHENAEYRSAYILDTVGQQWIHPLRTGDGLRRAEVAAVGEHISVLVPANEIAPTDPVSRTSATMDVRGMITPGGTTVCRTRARSFSRSLIW
jgi:hypothetical protein